MKPGRVSCSESTAAADRRLGFMDDYTQARLREHDRRREAVWTGADNNGIFFF